MTVQTMICIRVPMRKEYVRVVKWVRVLSATLAATGRIPVVCQSMTGVAYIQLTISSNDETGIGLTYALRISLISCLLVKETSSRVTGISCYSVVIVICEKHTGTRWCQISVVSHVVA